jgi:hypothetical protein
LRAPEDRLATVPDFLVEEVRLVAAAARFVVPLLRDFEAVPFADDFAAPRLELRAAVFLAPERVDEPPRAADERAEVERDEVVDLAGDFFADEREVVDFEAVFFAPDLAEDLAAVFLAPDFAEDFAAVLLAPERAEDFAAVFLAPAFAEDLAAVFLAPALVEDFAADLVVDFAAVFVPAFLAAVLFVAVLDAPLAAVERDEVPVDFAALLRAVVAPDFLAPDLAEDFEPFAPPVELPRELLFFAVFLVLVAPVSPVNNCVSGFDLSSVGIAASFKGLRVQPSRLQGNVVIPMRFRFSESVESRTGTFSVDIFNG